MNKYFAVVGVSFICYILDKSNNIRTVQTLPALHSAILSNESFILLFLNNFCQLLLVFQEQHIASNLARCLLAVAHIHDNKNTIPLVYMLLVGYTTVLSKNYLLTVHNHAWVTFSIDGTFRPQLAPNYPVRRIMSAVCTDCLVYRYLWHSDRQCQQQSGAKAPS